MDGSTGWEVDRCSMGEAATAAVTGHASHRLLEQFDQEDLRLSAIHNVVPPRGQRGGSTSH